VKTGDSLLMRFMKISHMFREFPLRDCHSSTPILKNGKRMVTDEQVIQTIMNWSNGLAADLYDEGVVKLVQRLDKCLNCNGDYVQK
jgi:hypothetical protein